MSALHRFAFSSLASADQARLRVSLTDKSAVVCKNLDEVAWPILSALLGLCVVGCVWNIGFGQLDSGSGWQTPPALIGYVIGYVMTVSGAWLAVTRNRLKRLFGFQPGIYWLAFCLVDARAEDLKIYDLTKSTGLQKTTHTTNGSYTKTTFALQFPGVHSVVFTVTRKKVAEGIETHWNGLRDTLRKASAANDQTTIQWLDPIAGFRTAGWPSVAIQERRFARYDGARNTALAFSLALAFSIPTWGIRNLASDQAMYQVARQVHTEAAYQQYVDQGWMHVEVMKDAMPRMALAEQTRLKSVRGLRAVLQRYPSAGLESEIATQIHQFYQQSFDRFKVRAKADGELVSLMGALLNHLESTGNPTVELVFSRPSTEALSALDQDLASRGRMDQGLRIVPASQHFSQANAVSRENQILLEFQRGFGAIFPHDVLTIQREEAGSIGRPHVFIRYTISPSGKTYVPKDDPAKGFVGLAFRFGTRVDVPARPDIWDFNVEVSPPDHFVVEYSTTNGQPLKGPEDGQVYAVMAQRAFDQLGQKLGGAFFSGNRPEDDLHPRLLPPQAPSSLDTTEI